MIYFIQDSEQCHIKIGRGERPKNRRDSLQTGNPSDLVLLLEMPEDRWTEAELHQKFSHARVRGEWFRPVPELLRFILSERSGQVETEFASLLISTASDLAAVAYRIAVDSTPEEADQRLAGLCGTIDSCAYAVEFDGEYSFDQILSIQGAISDAWKEIEAVESSWDNS